MVYLSARSIPSNRMIKTNRVLDSAETEYPLTIELPSRLSLSTRQIY